MPDRQEYIERIKHKVDEWNNELNRLEQVASQSGDNREFFDSLKPELEEVLEEMEERVEALRDSAPEQGEEIRAALDQGWHRLSKDLAGLCDRIYPGN